jgi:AcrR family transcriptional regulator
MNRAADVKTAGMDTRERILAAAEALTLEHGPGRLSIEAVAVRAGLSKGGVLYHFRTKAELLAALVRGYIEVNGAFIEKCVATRSGPNAMAEALIDAHRRMRDEPLPPPSGVLAAIAEHPDFLEPLRAHHAATVRRLRSGSAEPELAMIVYLALEGIKALRLFGFALLDREQEDAVMARMSELLRDAPPAA